MVSVKKITLDVLKPHQPNALEFSQAIAAVGEDYHVHLIVIEVDENTESLQIVVTGAAVDFAAIEGAVRAMGGSVHSIDEVEVHSDPNSAPGAA